MKERELMHDLLATEKQVLSAYSVGISECSCPNLRDTLLRNFESVQEIQYKVFDAMKQKGWYPTKDAPDADVNQVKSEANMAMSELR
jgi:spore coat protein CotF